MHLFRTFLVISPLCEERQYFWSHLKNRLSMKILKEIMSMSNNDRITILFKEMNVLTTV